MDAVSQKRVKEYKKLFFNETVRQTAENRASRIRTQERKRFLDIQRTTLSKTLTLRTTSPTTEEVLELLEKLRVDIFDLMRRRLFVSCGALEIPLSAGSPPLCLLTHNRDWGVNNEKISELHPLVASFYDNIDSLSEIFTMCSQQSADKDGCILTTDVFRTLRMLIENHLWSRNIQLVDAGQTWSSNQQVTFFAVEAEQAMFQLLCAVACVVPLAQKQLMEAEFSNVLLQTLYDPVSLRLVQVASWILASLGEEAPSTFIEHVARAPVVLIEQESQVATRNNALLFLVNQLTRLQHAITSMITLGPSVITTLGSTTPLNSLEGLNRALLSVTAILAASHNVDVCIPLLNTQISLHLIPFLVSRLYQNPKTLLSADSTLRIASSEALWTLAHCLDAVSEQLLNLQECDVIRVLLGSVTMVTLVDTLWDLALACVERMGLAREVETDATDFQDVKQLKSVVDVMSVDRDHILIDRLNAQPADLLIPCLIILRLLCALTFLERSTQDEGRNDCSKTVASMLLELETAKFQHKTLLKLFNESFFKDGVIGRTILSCNTALKRESVSLISTLAAGDVIHTEFCLRFVPLLLKTLLDPAPYFVKRPTAVALNRIAFNHRYRFLTHVFECKELPDTEMVQRYASIVDPFSVKESTTSAFGVCGNNTSDSALLHSDNNSLPLVVRVVLSQIHANQRDVPLVHILFDFLEEIMTLNEVLKLQIYQYGGVDIVESVQRIDDESVFARTVAIVERYFDDFDEPILQQ